MLRRRARRLGLVRFSGRASEKGQKQPRDAEASADPRRGKTAARRQRRLEGRKELVTHRTHDSRILSNSSMQQTPPSARTMAPPSRKNSPFASRTTDAVRPAADEPWQTADSRQPTADSRQQSSFDGTMVGEPPRGRSERAPINVSVERARAALRHTNRTRRNETHLAARVDADGRNLLDEPVEMTRRVRIASLHH